MSTDPEVRALLAHTEWLRALARSLVGDVHLAEDLAQDALVVALERPPRGHRSLRAWLATVLRNRLTDLGRERSSRELREREAARGEGLPSTHDIVAKVVHQRALVEAVLGLDEPYRTTILLRFTEDMPQREIARCMQTTVATVNSRLTRALAQLRERLARGGGREAWLPALLPLLRPIAPVTTLAIPAMKLAAAAVFAVSVLFGAYLWRSPSTERPAELIVPAVVAAAPESAARQSSSLGTTPDPAEPASEPIAGERAPQAPRASEKPVPSPVPAAEPRTVRGRVLDTFGNGLAGVVLALGAQEKDSLVSNGVAASSGRCTSGPGGWFELDVHDAAELVLAADPRYTTVLAGMARVLRATEPLVVVAPRIELAGTVVDESGAPVAGAAVEIGRPPGFGREWGLTLDYSMPQVWRAHSGPDGSFALADAPALESATLRAALGGYETHAEPAPLASDHALVLVLRRPAEVDGLVRGVVLDPEGAPVAGARVAARGETTFTDRAGEFTLDLGAPNVRPPLIAVKRGYQAAQLDPPRDERGLPAWPESVVLRLGGPTDTLLGRVVDDDGRAVAGVKVWLVDPTIFGRIGDYFMAAETIQRGDERFWSYSVTDAEGSFALAGLLDRAYRVRALDPETLVQVEREGLRASDSPVELVLPTRDVLERVAGRVVSQRGHPVPGASVRLFRQTFRVELPEGGRQNDGQQARAQLTDEDGAFEFTHVPKDVHVFVTGDTLLFAGTDLEREEDVTDIEVPVSLRLHVQVVLDAPHDRADALRVLDDGLHELVLHEMAGEGAHFAPRMPILDGRSVVLAVDESAAWLVLLRGEEEVTRIALELVPGDPTVVRY